MPRREDIEKILIVGAGPIVIGQACEFDYSGVQACKALKEEGYKVVLVNSNPATIMTDPDMADSVYIEPLNTMVLNQIFECEKPDAMLATMGGQTALNLALKCAETGSLEKHGVELIGAKKTSIEIAEDRSLFKIAMNELGLETAKSGLAHSLEEAVEVRESIAKVTNGTGFPVIIRPSFTLGGTGGGIAFNAQEFDSICRQA